MTMTDGRPDATTAADVGDVTPAATPALPVPAPPLPTRRGPRPVRPPQQGAAAVVSTASVMVTVVSLWMVVQMLLLSGLAHDRTQTVLFREFRVQLAETTAPLGPTIPVGDPVAIIKIPALGVEEVVVEGTASGDLLAGPGHQRGTPLPGQEGISFVMGRAATYGAPFARIGELLPGDTVEIITAQGALTLTVMRVRREGDPVPTTMADDVGRLTLVSAEGEGPLSALTPDTTVLVDAETTDAFPTPPGYGGALPASEKPMATDSTALPLLALWLALLIGLVLAIVSARQRWSAPLVWVMASPLALTLAWLTTDTAMRLLPNLL